MHTLREKKSALRCTVAIVVKSIFEISDHSKRCWQNAVIWNYKIEYCIHNWHPSFVNQFVLAMFLFFFSITVSLKCKKESQVNKLWIHEALPLWQTYLCFAQTSTKKNSLQSIKGQGGVMTNTIFTFSAIFFPFVYRLLSWLHSDSLKVICTKLINIY